MESGELAAGHRPGSGELWGCGCLNNSGRIATDANERRRFPTVSSGLAGTQREDPKFRGSCGSSVAIQRDQREEWRALATLFRGLAVLLPAGNSTTVVRGNSSDLQYLSTARLAAFGRWTGAKSLR